MTAASVEDPVGGWEPWVRDTGVLAKSAQEGDISSRPERTECIYQVGRAQHYSGEMSGIIKNSDTK